MVLGLLKLESCSSYNLKQLLLQFPCKQRFFFHLVHNFATHYNYLKDYSNEEKNLRMFLILT